MTGCDNTEPESDPCLYNDNYSDVSSWCEDTNNHCLPTGNDNDCGNYHTNSSSTVMLDNILDNIDTRLSWKNDTVSYSLENRIATLENLKLSIKEAKSDLKTIDQREAREINNFKYQLQNMETQISALDSEVVSKENDYFLAIKKYNQKLEGYEPLLKNIDIVSRNFEIQKDDILTEINNKIHAVFGKYVPHFHPRNKILSRGHIGQDWKKMQVGVETILGRPNPTGVSGHNYLHQVGIDHAHGYKYHPRGYKIGPYRRYGYGHPKNYFRNHHHHDDDHLSDHSSVHSHDSHHSDHSDHHHLGHKHVYGHNYIHNHLGLSRRLLNRGYRHNHNPYLHGRDHVHFRNSHWPIGGLKSSLVHRLGHHHHHIPRHRHYVGCSTNKCKTKTSKK